MSHSLDASMSPQVAFARLDAVVQELVVACQALYSGNWDDCAEDIRRRRSGQPYIYRLKVKIDDVLGWLTRLKAYEQARGERFADAIKADPQLKNALSALAAETAIETAAVTETSETGADTTALHDAKDHH